MTVETLISYLQTFDSEIEVRVCRRTKAMIPLLDPWGTHEVEVEVPILCAPTAEIDCLMHDPVTPNAPVLLVVE